MDLQVQDIKFKKDENGVCHAHLTLQDHTEKSHKFTTNIDTKKLHHVYQASGKQVTDELKTAFHITGLVLKKLSSKENKDFLIYDSDCTPELLIGSEVYYSKNNNGKLDDFEYAMSVCIDSINLYFSKEGETLKTPALS